MQQAHDGDEPTTEPGFYTRALRRGWRWLIVGLLVGTVAGAAYDLRAPRTYAASASVLVLDTGAPQTSAIGERTVGGDVNLDTEAQLVTSADVVAEVHDRTGDAFDPAKLANHVSITVPANTTVLRITFSARTPDLATLGARAFAQAYLDARARDARATIGHLIDASQRQLSAAEHDQSDLSRQLDAHPGPIMTADLRTRLQILSSTIATLNESLVNERSTVVTPGRIIDEPKAPSAPVSPNAHLLVPSGAAAGLAVGLGAALYTQRFRPRLRDPDDVDRELELPTLAEIVAVPKAGRPAVPPAQSLQSMAFVRLYRRLAQENAERLVVAPASSYDAALHVAANLATQARRSGRRTSLVVEDGVSAATLPAELPVIDLHGDPGCLERLHPEQGMHVTCLRPSSPLAPLLIHRDDPTVIVAVTGHDPASAVRYAVGQLESDGAAVAGVVLHAPTRLGARSRPWRHRARDGAPAEQRWRRLRAVAPESPDADDGSAEGAS